VVRNAESPIRAIKLEVVKNDPELFKFPGFPTFRLFGGYTTPHNFFVKSLGKV
jgi:hypothetical protein